MTCFVIFAHNNLQNNEDVQDLIDNIKFFNPDSDFVVNHPILDHPKVKVRHRLGPLDRSSFIFGAFCEFIESLSVDEIDKFDHYCLVSANQYFIRKMELDKETNYVQFVNTEDWHLKYTGKDFSTERIGNPLVQVYGTWDPLNLYEDLRIEKPMSSNWECLTLTSKSIILAKAFLRKCLDKYPNKDMINIFPGYMALMSGQEWKFPAHFGTYDPSNPDPKNWILTQDQVIQKWQQGYASVKRVNYSRDCPIKDFIRNNIMK